MINHLHRSPALAKPWPWDALVSVGAGTWMLVSPFLLNYREAGLAEINADASGTLFLLLGTVAVVRSRPWTSLAAIPVSLWLYAAPWTLGFANVRVAAFNAVIVGALICQLSVWKLVSHARTSRRNSRSNGGDSKR